LPFTQLTPLDDQGLRSNRPPNEVKWRKLTNVIPRDGFLQRRGGFVNPFNIDQEDLPAGQAGTPIVIGEIKNPGASVTGRAGFVYAAATIRPNATFNNNDWTREDGVTTTSLHLDIDDPGNPDASSIKSLVKGANVRFGFTDILINTDAIAGVVLRGRARLNITGARVTLNFYRNTLVAGNFIGSTVITSFEGSGGGPQWTDFQIPFAEFPSGVTIVAGNLNTLSVIVEYASAEVSVNEFLSADANGDDTGWKNAVSGATADFTDFDNRVIDSITDPSFVADDGITPAAVGDKQGVKFTGGTTFTYTTINGIVFFADGTKDSGADPRTELIYKNSVGTEFVIQTDIKFNGASSKRWNMFIISTTNPATSSNWTEADITGGQFILKYLGGGSNFKWSFTTLQVAGLSPSVIPRVDVDFLAVDALAVAADTEADHNVVGIDSFYVTTNQYLQFTERNLISNIGGTVPAVATGPLPLDHTILYGQAYVVNGVDSTRRYPTAGGIFEALGSNNGASKFITGRVVEAFADRIFYGWTNDNGVETPERLSWSNFQDGGDHTGTSSGDADLLDTPGGIVALGVLTEDFCTAIKQTGVYLLRRTGNSKIPFIRDVIDFHTGIIAPRTLKTMVTPDGITIQLFLGFNPAKGRNVFMFDGSQVRAIGDEIHKELRDDANSRVLASHSFAEMDPEGSLYWLFVPEGSEQLFPEQGFCFSLRNQQWYRFELPLPVTCAGIWTLPGDLTTLDTIDIGGTRTLMVGTGNGFPFQLDYTKAFDVIAVGDSTGDTYEPDNEGRLKIPFTTTFETGDLAYAGDQGFQTNIIAKRIYISYIDRGPVRVLVSASRDGGVTFNTAQASSIGSANDGSYQQALLDIAPLEGRRIRFKLEFDPTPPDENANPEVVEISEAWVEWELTGEAP